MNILKAIDTFIKNHNLLEPQQTIVVGLSGGPDSVFLLHYLLEKQHDLKLNLIAAHLDHEWRESSAQDAEFCKALCAKLNVTFISRRLSELNINIKSSGSKEQDARKARRFFFETIAVEYDANGIALAQHKNDQEETFFIRLLRGSSLSGLCGMWPKRGLYIRPLLPINKKEILTWLTTNNIAYVTDLTNISDDFLRNRIRNKLIPYISEIDSRFSTTLLKTMERLQQTELFLQRLTLQTFTQIAQFDNKVDAHVINKKAFMQLDPVMQYRILVHWLTLESVQFPVTQTFFDEVIRFIEQPVSKMHEIHELWGIIKKRNSFYITKHNKR